MDEFEFHLPCNGHDLYVFIDFQCPKELLEVLHLKISLFALPINLIQELDLMHFLDSYFLCLLVKQMMISNELFGLVGIFENIFPK